MEIKSEFIIPTGNRILIEVYKGETVTDSGLELSDAATNNAPVIGVILRTGPNSTFKVGDRVFYRRYSIDELTILSGGEEQKVYFLEDTDILGTYNEDVEEKDKYRQITEKKGRDLSGLKK